MQCYTLVPDNQKIPKTGGVKNQQLPMMTPWYYVTNS